RLRQILTNLVGNAIKFTEKGEIVLTVEESDRAKDGLVLHFSIADTGIGIPLDKQRIIFDVFAQADSSMTRKYGGTGLGLAICSQLVDLLGGRIWVESTAGQGSRFHFTAYFGLQHAGTQKASPAAAPPLAGLPLLLVEDNATSRLYLRQWTSHWGLKTKEAQSADEAIVILEQAKEKNKPFRIILLDATLPANDSFITLDYIKDNPEIASSIIMMMSSTSSRVDATPWLKLGISSHLSKPIKPTDLKKSLLQLLGLSAKPDEQAAAETQLSASPIRQTYRILIAEDNLVNQRVAIYMLEKQGHQVLGAMNGEEALEALEKGNYELILMDVQMPKMDGFQTTRTIREREKKTGLHIPIVAMTAHAMKGDRERCLEVGMDDYISKPLNAKQLNETILRVMSQHQAAPDSSTLQGKD
ncbi:MAG: response regulator, partial [Acidobacteriota bacterium]